MIDELKLINEIEVEEEKLIKDWEKESRADVKSEINGKLHLLWKIKCIINNQPKIISKRE